MTLHAADLPVVDTAHGHQAMVAGFCAAYPVNWWLVSAGIKEWM